MPELTNLYYTDARARGAITGTAPVAYNSTSGVISMAAATSVANGYLSSSDWLTFNNKQEAITAASTVNSGSLSSSLQNGCSQLLVNAMPPQIFHPQLLNPLAA